MREFAIVRPVCATYAPRMRVICVSCFLTFFENFFAFSVWPRRQIIRTKPTVRNLSRISNCAWGQGAFGGSVEFAIVRRMSAWYPPDVRVVSVWCILTFLKTFPVFVSGFGREKYLTHCSPTQRRCPGVGSFLRLPNKCRA